MSASSCTADTQSTPHTHTHTFFKNVLNTLREPECTVSLPPGPVKKWRSWWRLSAVLRYRYMAPLEAAGETAGGVISCRGTLEESVGTQNDAGEKRLLNSEDAYKKTALKETVLPSNSTTQHFSDGISKHEACLTSDLGSRSKKQRSTCWNHFCFICFLFYCRDCWSNYCFITFDPSSLLHRFKTKKKKKKSVVSATLFSF